MTGSVLLELGEAEIVELVGRESAAALSAEIANLKRNPVISSLPPQLGDWSRYLHFYSFLKI